MTKDLFGNIKTRHVITAKADIKMSLQLNVKGVNIDDVNKRLASAISRASATIATDLKAALDKALRSNVWPTLSGNADIYDTGKLLQSGKVIITNNSIQVVYDEPYAMLVHYGGYITPYGNQSTEKVYLPPRPWVEAVLNGNGPVPQFDFIGYYKAEIEREFR